MREVAYMAARVFGGGFSIMLIWFYAPSWLGAAGRILLTMLILLTWPVWILIRHFRGARSAGRPAEEPPDDRAAERQVKAAPPPPRGTYEELAQGAKEVVQWLRVSKLGSSGDSAYALPWYLVAGPTSGGKSLLLKSSGMNFHALPSQRPSEQNVIRPTRRCDWRVADTSVWLDTSGRYQTEGDDRDEWAALIETVKRYRKWRPLDGFLLVVNAAELLRVGEAESQQQAKVLRACLDEAMRRAGCQFPVYLVFTHMDELEGFSEFFHPFGEEERGQVWGATIPLAKAGHALARFDKEFDHLYWRLIRRRVVQLGLTPEPERQLRVFKFPGRFRRAKAGLGRFTAELFRPNQFTDNPLLRGFYFTGRDGAETADGYCFARHLFNDVVLPDRYIVASKQAERGKPRLGRNLLLAAAAALLLTFTVGMVVSYFGNERLIAEGNRLGRKLMDVRRQSVGETRTDQLAQELDALKDVRLFLERLRYYEQNSPPLYLRFGLYVGDSMNAVNTSNLRHLYFEAVESRFMKKAVAGVEDDLRAFEVGKGTRAGCEAGAQDDCLGGRFDLLKVYLMLSNPGRVEDDVDRATFEQVLQNYFKAAAPPGGEAEALRHLNYIASQAHKADVSHQKPDEELVARVRAKLATSYPLIEHVYRGMVARVEAKAGPTPVQLASITNARTENVLSGQYVVPGSFTFEGYKAMTDRIESSAAEDFRKQEWVVREAGTQPQEFGEQQSKRLAGMYQVEYATHWQKFLEDVKVRDYSEKGDTMTTLRVLSGRNAPSPLESVLREVASQTNLSASRGAWGWVKGLFSSEPNIGETRVEEQFRPLILFVSGKKGASLTKYLNDLQSVAEALNGDQRSLTDISRALQSKQGSVGRLEEARSAVTNTLAESRFAAGDAAAKLLRQPLDNLYSRLAVIDFEQLEKNWQETLAKAQPLEAGFPFGAGNNVPLTAVALYFNPRDGQLANFFNNNLRPYFKDDWTPKAEATDRFSPQLVKYLADARRLSAALFPNGDKQPAASYQIELVRPPESWTVTVEIDGNPPLTNERPARQFNWPGDRSGVLIKVIRLDDPGAKPFSRTGEWALLSMSDGKGGPFTVQAAGVSLKVQPMPADPRAGDIFRRELFALRAPKEIRPPRAQ